ncbi:MAG: choice-of-anchor D domain-containing protein, partial [Dehalococcoidia bacterium]
MLHRLPLVIAVVVVAISAIAMSPVARGLSAANPAAPAPSTSRPILSAPTARTLAFFDGIGYGSSFSSKTFDEANATFSSSWGGDASLNITIRGNDGYSNANLRFTPPDRNGLKPGTYEDTHDWYGPHLSVDIDGSCSATYGRFTIYESTMHPDGSITFAASFEEQCGTNGSGVSGEFRMNSSVSFVEASSSSVQFWFGDSAIGAAPVQNLSVTSLGIDPAVFGQAQFTGADAGDFSITSDSCSGQTLPATAECSVSVAMTPFTEGAKYAALEIPDNTYRGRRLVQLSGYAIPVGTISAMYLDDNRGGQSLLPPSIAWASPHQIDVYLPSAPPPSYIRLQPPTGEVFDVGTYDNTSPAPGSGQAGLLVSSSYICAGGSGRLTFDDIAFNYDGSLARLAASFLYRCPGLGLTGALYGEIRYRSDVPLEAPVFSKARVQFPAGAPPTQSVDVTNAGSIPAHVDVAGIFGSDAADFSDRK